MKILEKEGLMNEVEIGGWKVSADYGIMQSPEAKTLVMEPRLSKLMYLLSLNVNTIVSRGYLIKNIWTDTIVNEESLTRAVADLRKVLSQNFDNAFHIDTIPKRGYRLIWSMEPKKYALKLKLHPKVFFTILGSALFFLILIWARS